MMPLTQPVTLLKQFVMLQTGLEQRRGRGAALRGIGRDVL